MSDELEVILKLKDEMSRGFEQVNKTLEGLGTGFQRTSKSVEASTVALGNIFSSVAAKVKNFVNESVALGSQLDELSKKTGLTTDFLQKLGNLATASGTSLQTLSIGISGLQKKAFQAAEGSEEASKSFKHLGISVKDSTGQLKVGEQLFTEVIKSISSLENQTEQAAIAQEIFGRAGREIIPIIKDYGSAIDEAMEASGNMVSLSRDQIAALDRLGDTWDIMTNQVKAGIAIMVSELSPSGNLIVDIFAAIRQAVGYLVIEFMGLYERVMLLPEALKELYNEILVFVGLREQANALGGVMEKYNEISKITQDRQIALVEETKKYSASLNKLAGNAKLASKELSEMNKTMDKTEEAVKKHLSQFEGPEFDALQKRLHGTGKTLSEMIERGERVGEVVVTEEKKIQEETGKTTEEFDKLKNKIDEIDPVVRRLADSIRDSLSDAFERMMQGAEKFEDVLAGFFDSIKRAFLKMVADMAADAVLGNLRGSLGSLFGGGGGGGGGFFGGGGGAVTAAGAGIGGLGSLIPFANTGASPQFQQQVQTANSSFMSSVMPIVGGLGLGAGAIMGGLSGQSDPLSGALGGALGGLTAFGPIGGIIGGIGGGIASIFGQDDAKAKQQRAAKTQAAILAAQQAQLRQAEVERQQALKAAQEAEKARIAMEEAQQMMNAQGLLETHIRSSFAGGLATTDAAKQAFEVLQGGISPEEVNAFGGPKAIVSKQGDILRMASAARSRGVDLGGVTVQIQIGQMATTFDIDRLSEMVGSAISRSLGLTLAGP